jgi:hypothetical protein
MSSEDEKINLPAMQDDGWNDRETDDRTIQGTSLKCVDGVWTRGKETTPLPSDTELIAISTLTCLVRFRGEELPETIFKQPGQDLPDPDALNAEIPESEWLPGLNGDPRPPWQEQRVCYLLKESTAEKFTFATTTIGGMRAVRDLKDAVQLRRWLNGSTELAVVKLSRASMPTKRGPKIRPHFEIVRYVSLGGGPTPVAGSGGPTPRIADASAKPAHSIKELLDDEIPF